MMAMRSRGDGHTSDLVLDHLLADELDSVAAAAMREHLGECAACTSRLREIESLRDAYRVMMPALPTRAPRTGLWQRWQKVFVPAGALVAAIGVLLALTFGGARPSAQVDEGTRLKGGDSIQFYVKRGDEVMAGQEGMALRAGDAVRFAYSARKDRFLMIVSIDGSGVVSVYHSDGGRAAKIHAGTNMMLEGSVILDEVVGPERVYGMFCEEAIGAAEAIAATRRDPPTLPGCFLALVRWNKVIP